MEGYRTYLEKMWGFCAALETQLRHEVFCGALADYESRRKVPLLTQDLVAIGVNPSTVALLPHCDALPVCREPATAFGCAYVLEGATLGGRTLLPLVQSRLGFNAQSGARFLASYGEEVSLKWRSFGAALDAYCLDPERQTRAKQAAVATFDTLDAWLCGVQL